VYVEFSRVLSVAEMGGGNNTTRKENLFAGRIRGLKFIKGVVLYTSISVLLFLVLIQGK
jgi:hypothetical protein